MCPFPPTPPPGLTFFWPWQAPGYWLVLCILVLVYTLALRLGYPRLVARAGAGIHRDLAVGLLSIGYACVVIASIAYTVVGLASSNALSAWVDSQRDWASANGCTTGLATTEALLRSSIHTVLLASWITFLVGVLLVAVAFGRAALWQAMSPLVRPNRSPVESK